MKYFYYEEGYPKIYTEDQLSYLWYNEIDQSNFSDYDSWKEEAIKMQILIPA